MNFLFVFALSVISVTSVVNFLFCFGMSLVAL